MIYLTLFFSFLKVGAFCFGGGYAALPLIQSQVTQVHEWLSPEEFADLLAISQMTPGPIAINAATFVGTRVAGLLGAAAATAGYIAPSCVFMSAVAWFYMRFRKLDLLQGILKSLRPAVTALIAAAGVSVIAGVCLADGGSGTVRWRMVLLFAVSMALLRSKRLGPVAVMAAAGLINLLLSLI